MLRRKRKRVLMVVESFARGGAERQILVLSEGLLRCGYEVCVFQLVGVVPGQANFEDELAQLGIALWDATLFAGAPQPAGDLYERLAPLAQVLPANYPAICRGLAAAIAKFAPDVVNG